MEMNSLNELSASKENQPPTQAKSSGFNIKSTGFSLQEILTEDSFKTKVLHSRCQSTDIEVLTPKFLFAHKKPLSFQHHRKPLNSTDPKLRKIALNELEELNNTTSCTSYSRRISEFDCSRSAVLKSEPRGMSYCNNCQKLVCIVLNYDDSDLEANLVRFFYYFIACWEPKWTDKYKKETCEECGYAI